jgi:hypothetical protein
MRNLLASAGFLLLTTGDAAAQDMRPPAEVGVSFGGMFTTDHEDFGFGGARQATGDVRLTLPLTPRFSFEAIVTAGRRQDVVERRIEGLYVLQIKQQLRSAVRGAFHPFLTYGVAGYHAHVRRRPPGTGAAVSFREIAGPWAVIAGGGGQYQLTPRLALRAEAQLVAMVYLPIALRSSVGVSIPLGSYRGASTRN